MRNTFARNFYEAAKKDPRLSMVVADISPAGAMQEFQKEFPKRFINTGVAEQIMIGISAGMAMRGFRPFVYTIGTFALYRPFEFIRDDICYQNLPVTIVGIGGGLTYSTLGSTHHSQEDIAVARAIPNLMVVAPCDPEEVIGATKWCAEKSTGPVYLRLGKAGEPNLARGSSEPFVHGKLRYLQRGGDICIIGYGPILSLGFELAEKIVQAGGIVPSVISSHTLKPLDDQGIKELFGKYRRIIVIEEMIALGGLGESIKLLAWESQAKTQIDCFSLKHEFIHCYGSHSDILSIHHLDIKSIGAALKGYQ